MPISYSHHAPLCADAPLPDIATLLAAKRNVEELARAWSDPYALELDDRLDRGSASNDKTFSSMQMSIIRQEKK